MRIRLVKMADQDRAIFCGHNREGTEPEMEGLAEIDHVVA